MNDVLLVSMTVNMGNHYLKKVKFCQILKTKTLITSYRPRQFAWKLEGRLLLGTPRNNPVPTLTGHSHCIYGKSKHEKTAILSYTQN